MPAHEHTINTALGEVLQELRPNSWNVRAEERGALRNGAKRPDVLIIEPAGWPVVIEAERENYAGAEQDALARLGETVTGASGRIESAIALVYSPDVCEQTGGRALRAALCQTDALEYALYTATSGDAVERLPETGWLRGNVRDLAMLAQRAAIPAQRVERLVDALEHGVYSAENEFNRKHRDHTGDHLGPEIAEILGQSDDQGGQTRRMAMTVLINALIFHESLAQAEFKVGDDQRRVSYVRDFLSDVSGFDQQRIIDEWRAILDVNYWPIFATAAAVYDRMPIVTADVILRLLWDAAQQLIRGGVTKSHDLTGVIFQRLIADRKFLATFYTRPASAALLAGLAIPADQAPGGAEWGDEETIASLQIGDFACGTGTLLSAAYQRISLLHELNGGDPKALHRPMMKNGLVGLDVLNIAVHLTAAMLAGAHHDTPFDGECLLTMPFGKEDAAVGSLELLAEEVQPSLISSAAAITAGGRKPENVRDLVTRIGHNKFDLSIMNPPFTNAIAHEGSKVGVGNPAFAAFETPTDTRDRMVERLNSLAGTGKIGNLRAGLGSHFVDLAIRKTAKGGSIAFVLPLSAMAGIRWEKTRRAIADNFGRLTVATIAAEKSEGRSFSTDTGIAECLVVASEYGERAVRGTFVVLNEQPSSPMRAELIADIVSHLNRNGHIDEFENGDIGATRIALGNEDAGFAISFPLPDSGPWPMAGLLDVELAQVAHHLTRGQLHRLGAPNTAPINVPIVSLSEIASVGYSDMEIIGNKPDGSPQGAFDLHRPPINPTPTYPMLWRHYADLERQLIVLPDSEGTIKEWQPNQEWVDAKAARIQGTASRAHYNRDLQFNSQSLIVAMTERTCIGGRAWPSVVLEDPGSEPTFSLWCNSSLGLLMHWWVTNKSQAGRGTTTVTAIASVPTLDLRALTDAQHAAAREAFEAMRELRFLPFDQIDEDPARAELDRRLLVDVLGLPAVLCEPGGPIDLLRRKLAREPQIHGGKKSRVVFTDDGGEKTERRDDRD